MKQQHHTTIYERMTDELCSDLALVWILLDYFLDYVLNEHFNLF